MNKLALFVLCLAAMACSAADDDEQNREPQSAPRAPYVPKDVVHQDSLRILDIGNSYTEDVTAMLPAIVQANNFDVSTMCLYKAVRGSGSFKTWYDTYHDADSQPYYINKVVGGMTASIATGQAQAGDGSLFRSALHDEHWDLIILHPVSSYAPYFAQWFTHGAGGYLTELMALIKELQPQAAIGFYVTHSLWSGHAANKEQSAHSRWELTVSSVEQLLDSYDIDLIIPYGTAVENLRLSTWDNGYDLTRDGTHLEYGLTRYAAACCYYETILAPRNNRSIMGSTFSFDATNANTLYPAISVTDDNVTVAQQAAVLAVGDWHHCYNPEATDAFGAVVAGQPLVRR